MVQKLLHKRNPGEDTKKALWQDLKRLTTPWRTLLNFTLGKPYDNRTDVKRTPPEEATRAPSPGLRNGKGGKTSSKAPWEREERALMPHSLSPFPRSLNLLARAHSKSHWRHRFASIIACSVVKH